MPLKVAIVFDSPYEGWDHDRHAKQLEVEVARSAAEDFEPDLEYQAAAALGTFGHDIRFIGLRDDLAPLVHELAANRPDVVFNCAESFAGNATLEYVVPAVLEAYRVPYCGSPPLGLMLSRDKALAKELLSYHGIRVARFFTCRPGESPCIPEGTAFPLIVKPLATDASEGIAQASVVWDAESLASRAKFVHENFHMAVIIEQFVEGRELYVSLLGNGDDIAVLPLTELVFDKEKNTPEERIATRRAKWDVRYRERRGIRNQYARPLSAVARERIAHTCRTAFRALGLADYARCDVRLDADDEVWLVEANANPYIAEGHDFAEAAHKGGLEYPQFMQRLLDLALARAARG
jgi:D-alanine-D-alanine ligase